MRGPENPIRLLIHSHGFWPAVGGAETYARALAEGLSADGGQRITLVTKTPHGGPEPEWGFPLLRKPTLRKQWKVVRAADAVFIAGPSLAPMILAVLARKPFVIEHHGYKAICPNSLLLNKARGGVCPDAFRNKRYGECRRCVSADRGRVRALAEIPLTLVRHWLCHRAYAHVGVSEHVRKRHGFENMTVIYHGLPDLLPLAGVGTPEPRSGDVHFGYVGRLVEEKGLALLIAASGKLRSRGVRHKLSFIGDGPLRDSLRAQAAAVGLNDVHFTGFLEGEALQRATAGLDVVVMPSVWEETAGLAAMEQMMRGRAVLAADIGGLGEVVGDGGVKFRPLDLEHLAERMTELTSPELRSRVGVAARARALQLFQLDRMIRDHKALFLEASQSRRPKKNDA